MISFWKEKNFSVIKQSDKPIPTQVLDFLNEQNVEQFVVINRSGKSCCKGETFLQIIYR